MEEEFIPHEESLALRELGFDEPCFGFYLEDGKWVPASYSIEGTEYPSNIDLLFPGWSSAVLYQQAFKWFRDKHNLFSYIVREKGINEGKIKYVGIYHKISERGNGPQDTCVPGNTYEEAELECLRNLIEIVKQFKKK
jgi:hypothetical protein